MEWTDNIEKNNISRIYSKFIGKINIKIVEIILSINLLYSHRGLQQPLPRQHRQERMDRQHRRRQQSQHRQQNQQQRWTRHQWQEWQQQQQQDREHQEGHCQQPAQQRWHQQHRPIGAGAEWDHQLSSLPQQQHQQQHLQAEGFSSSNSSTTTSTGENGQHRMVRIDLDIVPITALHKVAIWTPSTEDNIDTMVFEASIGQSVLPPEVISNTITYILNLRHQEVKLRSIYQDHLEVVIDQTQRQSSFGITVHLEELRRQHLPQQQQVIIDRLKRWTITIGIHIFLASTFLSHINIHCKSVIDDINQDRASSSSWRPPLHQPQVQQPTLTTASASSSSPTIGEINTTLFDPQPTSTTPPLDQHPRGTSSGLDAQLRATSSTTSAYTTGPPAEHLQQEYHNIFMMEAIEEEQPDITSYILQALTVIKELWTMNVYIGKVTKPSGWTRLLRNLHLQECEDDDRIYLNIRTGIEFRIIVFFLCDYVICLARPSMTGAVRYNLSLIVQNLNLMDLEETSIDINDYIAEEAQHLTHHDFLHHDHLLQLLPIELAMTLREHIPRDHLAYDPQCHHCQHLLHPPKSSTGKGGKEEEEEDINNITAYQNRIIIQQKKNENIYYVNAIILNNADAQLEHRLQEQLAEVHLRHPHRQTAESSTSTTLIQQRDQEIQHVDQPDHHHQAVGPDEPQQLQHQEVQVQQCTQHQEFR